MKISDIARKLGMPIKELREKAKELGFAIAQKSNTMSDKKAKEFIDLLTQENKNNIKKETVEEPTSDTPENPEKKIISVPEIISVKKFSSLLDLPVTMVIAELMKNGVMASINENIDYDTAAIIGEILGFEIKKEKAEKNNIKSKEDIFGKKIKRPPVVAIIGHVDHGKTTLLDKIRQTNIAEGESGGITQHIGAYQVEKKGRKITFLDTPGHEAFSAMREHGVRITDIAVLVVAADDGVKPQTKESINFAKESGASIIVAINKIDKSGANIDKTKGELAELGLVAEDWGGETIMTSVSAKSGQGVEDLLDVILLVSDMKNIESIIDSPANGFVIESHLSASKGPLATILIRDGILKVGDSFTIGKNVFGKVRMITDYRGKKIKEAGPSDPIRIAGLSALPNFGDIMEVEKDLGAAKEKVNSFKKDFSFKGINGHKSSLATASSSVSAGTLSELRLIIKADFLGSLQAIRDSLGKLQFLEARVKIINDGVGEINESDIKLASATDSLIIGFRVAVGSNAKKLQENMGVAIEIFPVIYELIDKVTMALSGLLSPEAEEIETGSGVILKIFKDGKREKILGVRVESGLIEKESKINVYRERALIASGKILSMKKVDQIIDSASKGVECGLGIMFKASGDEKVIVEEGNKIIATKKEYKEKELTKI